MTQFPYLGDRIGCATVTENLLAGAILLGLRGKNGAAETV
jgi:hypothetical protein